MTLPFQLLLFSTDPALIRRLVRAGVAGVVVDWERAGKDERQAGADTQIATDTLQDLERVRASTEALVLCRVNPPGPRTTEEIDAAVDAGADEILIPMVRSADEVESVLDHVNGRCGVGIMVETIASVRCAATLAELPITRAYAGLNDLAIERKSPSIFTAVTDGTIARLRQLFSVRFGFGGLTLPDRGSPIPCRLLIAEMMRLRCDFGTLRRSFHRDIAGLEPATGVARIRESVNEAARRSGDDIERDHEALVSAVRHLDTAPR